MNLDYIIKRLRYLRDEQPQDNEEEDLCVCNYYDELIDWLCEKKDVDKKLADIAEKRLEFIQRLLAEPKVTIDEWGKKGPCVTVHYEGKEYVGTLEEWREEE